MALTKVQADGVNLGDTFAFTGTVTGAGKVLQIVSDHGSATTTINSTSYSDIGMSVNITPSSTSSSILCFVSGALQQDDGNGALSLVRLRRGTTEISSSYAGFDSNDNAATFSYSIMHIDSPATTSQITYSVQARTTNSSSDFRPKGTGDNIILLEISG
jgi:hypothetical protein